MVTILRHAEKELGDVAPPGGKAARERTGK